MSNIDDAIRQALSADDARALEQFAGEQSLFEQALGTVQGRLMLPNIAGWLGGFALFIAAGWSVWRFVEAGDLRTMVLWGCAAALAIFTLGLVKVWFWMEMQKNATVREIKRLELQVARLAARLPA